MDKSVSGYLADLAERDMLQDTGYQEAMAAWLKRPTMRLRKSARDKWPSREELNVRPGLR